MYVISRVFEDNDFNACRRIIKTGYASYEAAEQKVAGLLAADIAKYADLDDPTSFHSEYGQLTIGDGEIVITYDICEVTLEA